MPKYKILFEYDGTNFHGWQIQPRVRTIQEELHKAIEIYLGEKSTIPVASGRTDAGVHARAQVAHFTVGSKLDEGKFMYAISSLLKNEVAVLSIKEVSDDFHSQRDALSKQYSYYILNRKMPPTLNKKVWHVSADLNLVLITEESKALIGEHNFSSFRSSNCCATTAIKTISNIAIVKENDMLKISIEGKGFLKNMVRIIVGTLVDRGKTNTKLESIGKILKAQDRERAGRTAPPEGLFLDWVKY